MIKFLTGILFFLILQVSQAGQFSYPVGARSSAMGNASVTLTDAWSCFNNQAGLGYIKTINAGANYENRFLMPELSVKSFALAIPFKGTTFGISASSFGYHLYSENKYGFALAKSFGDKISVAVQMDYLRNQIAEGYGNKNLMTVEMGIMAKPMKNLIIAAHLFNPVRSKLNAYNNELLPTIMKLGASYMFSEKVLFAAEVNKSNIDPAQFRAGLEYHIVKELFLRAGMGTDPAVFSFGIGLHLKQIKIDISSAYNQVLGYSPQMSLMYCPLGTAASQGP